MIGRPKLVLLGMLTKMPVGGVLWQVSQYLLGFERLGYETYYVEAHARTPSMFVGPDDDGSATAAAFLDAFTRRLGLNGRWALHALHSDGRVYGMTEAHLRRVYREAAVIVNLHGGTLPRPEHTATGRLVLLNTDPVQLELELDRHDARAIEFVDAHSALFTWALNHGNADCRLPLTARHPFVPTVQPVLLDQWVNDADPHDAPFTTVGNWRQPWRELTFRGERYTWSKHHEFLKLLDLPGRTRARLELALSSYEPADRALLEQHGWRVRHGLDVSSDAEAYRAYVIGSRGEFTVAKDQNVRFRSGWFSERSAAYLAAGRPVVMQDTGFGAALPTGAGLLPFTDVEDAAAALDAVLADEKQHRHAALAIARDHLAHDVVLGALLEHLDLPVPSRRRAPAPTVLPADLDLRPRSRRPLVLDPRTEQVAVTRPVPTVPVVRGTPDTSIVVAVHDNLAVTRLALESVLTSTSGAFELVVVDNGSAEPTARYLAALAARNRAVRLIRNDTNHGFAPAVNQGLGVATAPVLVVLNNDVVVTPGWLTALRARLADPLVGLVGPTTNRCGNAAEVPADYDTYGELRAFAARRSGEPFDIEVATLFCAAMRRSVRDEVGALDERFELGLFEDDDYSRRVRAAGYRVVCDPAVFVHHFGEATLGLLAADGRYGALFDANRARFEAKWGEPWTPHERHVDPDYVRLRDRARLAIAAAVPEGATVAVVSHGDDELLDLPGRRGRHFPAMPDGVWAGEHPADGADALARLDAARRAGADYLALPAPCAWWLDFYPDLAARLSPHLVAATPGTVTVYRLGEAS
ncbi:MAG: glycosyltransferase family 2 protein [Jatrophihabitans sp.]|uniref:glycosyltransferase family 2 protein n=1 Tax=Jatrophihabitans sp. TaxID=1932789 RepID=UPI003F80B656